MWDVTEWAVVTWLKTTLVLAAGVGACWLFFGTSSPWFALAVGVAGLGEVYATRQLAREWAHEAALRWWWTS